MKIVFTLTKKDIWLYHWRKLLPHPAMLILRLCVLLAVLSVAIYYRGHGMLFAAIMGLGGSVPLMNMLLNMKAVRAGATGERIAEIGKLNLYYGALTSRGSYYQWIYLEDVKDDRGFLCFSLPRDSVLLIPKSVFPTLADAEKFLALAFVRWETAKMNQQYALAGAGEGVWPPAPRIES